MSHTVPTPDDTTPEPTWTPPPCKVPVTFDPTAVVAEVLRLLAHHGLDVVVGARAAQCYDAAAALLEAMGITPDPQARYTPLPRDYSRPPAQS